MSLTRSDLLIINATVIAGVLILLTLSNLTFSNFFRVDELSTESSLKEILILYLVLSVIFSIIPFALSSILELNRERFLRRFEIKEKLDIELKNAEENKNIELIKEIKKTKGWYDKHFKPTSKQILQKNLYQRDEPRPGNIGITIMGFAYLTASVILFVLVNSIPT